MALTPPDRTRYARPRVDSPAVLELRHRVAPAEKAVRDLGGTMSLNLHLASQGLVLRVHAPGVEEGRLEALRALRRHVSALGVLTAVPIEVDGEFLLRSGPHLAEVEPFIAHERPPPTWASYLWMFEQAGRLDRALMGYREVPEPAVATYGTPERLRAELRLTARAVQPDREAAEFASRVGRLVDQLEQSWVDPRRLPQQVVHGDIRLGNVARTPTGEAAFFDFGFAACRPRIHELAYALSWVILRPDATGTAEAFPWDRLPEILSAYEAGSRGALLPIERAAIAPYLAAVPLYLAAVSAYTAQPARHLREELPFIQIAAWVVNNIDALASSAGVSRG